MVILSKYHDKNIGKSQMELKDSLTIQFNLIYYRHYSLEFKLAKKRVFN
jgi:hypothetical protein